MNTNQIISKIALLEERQRATARELEAFRKYLGEKLSGFKPGDTVTWERGEKSRIGIVEQAHAFSFGGWTLSVRPLKRNGKPGQLLVKVRSHQVVQAAATNQE